MQVQTFGFPPLEEREKSTSLFTGIDYFGGGTLAKEEFVSFLKPLMGVICFKDIAMLFLFLNYIFYRLKVSH